jgi:hypothetical protein
VVGVNTEQQPWTSVRVLATTVWVSLPSVCGCGQDLDVCVGSHCPRCGTLLAAHAA